MTQFITLSQGRGNNEPDGGGKVSQRLPIALTFVLQKLCLPAE